MAGYSWLSRQAAHLFTFLLAAAASMALTMTTYTEAVRQTHLTPFLVLLITLHLFWHSRFVWHRGFLRSTVAYLGTCSLPFCGLVTQNWR